MKAGKFYLSFEINGISKYRLTSEWTD